jgi:hypothetical protein
MDIKTKKKDLWVILFTSFLNMLAMGILIPVIPLLLTDTSSPAADGSDFLNSYFFKPFPLENNSFSLVLSKVIFGTSNNSNNEYYNQQNEIQSLPEILPAEALTYWGVKPKVKITDGTEFNDFVVAQTAAYYNARLPKLRSRELFRRIKKIIICNASLNQIFV